MESAIIESGSLGRLTRIVSRKRRNYDLQAIAADLLPNARVSWCSRRAKAPVIEIRKQGEKLYYYGLAVCGSVWTCPVCAERISLERRKEIDLARKNWAAVGGSMCFVTFTYQHSIDDRLDDLLDDLNKAWRQFRGGRRWMEIREKYQIAASVANLEITYSLENGYHPHKHIGFFSRLSQQEFDAAAFEREALDRWKAILRKHGRYASEEHGVVVETVLTDIGGYFTKWSTSDEIALSNRKLSTGEHFGMFQLLELHSQGNKFAGIVFREYAKATKGRKQLTWGRGDRELLGLGDEIDDMTLAAAEPEPTEIICAIDRDIWALVCKYEKRGELLFVAATYGSQGVRLYLDDIEARYQLGSGEP